MINKLIDKVMAAKPVHLALLMLLMPFLTAITCFIIQLFTGYDLFVILGVAITIMVCVQLLWLWGICVQNRLKVPFETNTFWFRIAFWVYFSYCIFGFIVNINGGRLNEVRYVDDDIIGFLNTLAAIYGLAVLVSFGYISIFTAKILASSIDGVALTSSNYFQYAPMIWVFPIGIPLLQSKIQGKPTILDAIKKNSPFQ
jgi:hypothetical protein